MPPPWCTLAALCQRWYWELAPKLDSILLLYHCIYSLPLYLSFIIFLLFLYWWRTHQNAGQSWLPIYPIDALLSVLLQGLFLKWLPRSAFYRIDSGPIRMQGYRAKWAGIAMRSRAPRSYGQCLAPDCSHTHPGAHNATPVTYPLWLILISCHRPDHI